MTTLFSSSGKIGIYSACCSLVIGGASSICWCGIKSGTYGTPEFSNLKLSPCQLAVGLGLSGATVKYSEFFLSDWL